jgi:Ser/Thr protein kinase RdoA (MazF antagonist)
MDDQQTYLLNGLLTRQFGLGRIVRFRAVARGRQAQTFEILTQQQHEYTVYLYPPAFAASQLDFAARTINMLDANRFSVVPMLAAQGGGGAEESFTAEGPQGATMLVSLTTTGSAVAPEQYTDHDISQLGLRLAWLHRLLREHVPAPVGEGTLRERLAEELDDLTPDALRYLPSLPPGARDKLLGVLEQGTPQGWVHGDIQGAALLLDADHQLRTLVDFGLLHDGSPLEDVVDAALHFCVDGAGAVAPARARSLLEAYDSLLPLKDVAWTPVVASWLGQRLIDAARARRALPKAFSRILSGPETLATAIASCV